MVNKKSVVRYEGIGLLGLMLFTPTNLKGVFIITPEKREDHRGFFARAWCKKEFETHGLNTDLVQVNVGFSKKQGTLRGMHFQTEPYEECKLVRCTMGEIVDVVIDLRPDSPTHKQWISVELSADNRTMLYVPEGFAHGYLTLVDNTEVAYQTSQFYEPGHAKGVRFDDPAFGITWPRTVDVISEADRNWPLYLL
jgi:dTDP-4-dehydrorhamnose 3,5-epimerase